MSGLCDFVGGLNSKASLQFQAPIGSAGFYITPAVAGYFLLEATSGYIMMEDGTYHLTLEGGAGTHLGS
jgi:hypothetical protein